MSIYASSDRYEVAIDYQDGRKVDCICLQITSKRTDHVKFIKLPEADFVEHVKNIIESYEK